MEFVGTKTVNAKLVKIKDNKPIYPLGGIYGPTVPQVFSTTIIASLIQRGYHVFEVLKDGSEIQLNLGNFKTKFDGTEDTAIPNIITEPVSHKQFESKPVTFNEAAKEEPRHKEEVITFANNNKNDFKNNKNEKNKNKNENEKKEDKQNIKADELVNK
jgi:hypothetical protein